jgi:glycogen operon protein
MLVHGDELGRTQLGNNNVYCQDSELSWINWEAAAEHATLTDFTAAVSRLRREHPIFRRRRFFRGVPVRGGSGIDDIAWLRPAGDVMDDDDWNGGYAKSFAVFLNGQGIREPDSRGERVTDDSFLLCFNGHFEALDFTLPSAEYGESWEVALDTAMPVLDAPEPPTAKAESELTVPARALLVLRRVA